MVTMDILFKAKHWQIFGSYLFLSFINSIIQGINQSCSTFLMSNLDKRRFLNLTQTIGCFN